MAIRLAIIALACLTACGRIGYSTDQDPVGSGGDGDADAAIGQPGNPDAGPVQPTCERFEPFGLEEADTESVDPVIATFNMNCVDYCRLQKPVGLTHPACVSPEPTLEVIVNGALQHIQPQIEPMFPLGEVIDPADIVRTAPLSLSSDVNDVLTAIGDLTGSTASEAWKYEQETPCPNCTSFETVLILWYRDTQWVMVLYGAHGYDS